MNLEYIYRNGTIEDLEQLQKLGLNSFGQFRDLLTEENWNKLKASLSSESTYTDLLAKSNCFVCEKENEIIGVAYLIPKGNPTEVFHEDWSYLRMVGVHTEYAGKGIGKKLMQICVEHARNTGENFIALHTSEFMDAARHIYENMGFVRIKQLENRLGKRYWLYLLQIGQS